jgi:hypothetical protein
MNCKRAATEQWKIDDTSAAHGHSHKCQSACRQRDCSLLTDVTASYELPSAQTKTLALIFVNYELRYESNFDKGIAMTVRKALPFLWKYLVVVATSCVLAFIISSEGRAGSSTASPSAQGKDSTKSAP